MPNGKDRQSIQVKIILSTCLPNLMTVCPSWSTSPKPRDWSVMGTRVPPSISSCERDVYMHLLLAFFLAPTRSPPMPRNIQMGRNSRNKKTRHSDPFLKLAQSCRCKLFIHATCGITYSQSFWPSSHLLKGRYTCQKSTWQCHLYEQYIRGSGLT